MIDVQTKEVPGETLEQTVDKDLEAFDKWFQETLKMQPIVRSERAILKAYLWYKLKGVHAPVDQTDQVETGHGA